MGVAGAAWATVLSQLLSAVLCTIVGMRNFDVLRTRRADFADWRRAAAKHLAVGFPMGFQMSVMCIGQLAMQTGVNSLGFPSPSRAHRRDEGRSALRYEQCLRHRALKLCRTELRCGAVPPHKRGRACLPWHKSSCATCSCARCCSAAVTSSSRCFWILPPPRSSAIPTVISFCRLPVLCRPRPADGFPHRHPEHGQQPEPPLRLA